MCFGVRIWDDLKITFAMEAALVAADFAELAAAVAALSGVP